MWNFLTSHRPFQEGGASATSDRLLAGTSGNGGSVLDESQGGRPSSTGGVVDDSSVSFGDNGRLRRLLSHGDDSGDLSSADGPNKILKDLLNQKDEDDTQGGGTGSGDSIRFIHRIPHLESKPNTSSSPAGNSNNMLREVSIFLLDYSTDIICNTDFLLCSNVFYLSLPSDRFPRCFINTSTLLSYFKDSSPQKKKM